MDTTRNIQHPASSIKHRHAAFTLVELLVVITIIGILAALLTAAAVGAIKKGRETEIKAEINQIDAAINEYKNKVTAFPPNCQTDGPSPEPIDELSVLNDLKRHMNQVAPRMNQSEMLIVTRLAGLNPATGAQITSSPPANPELLGGMSAGEALVFWLSGFSADPKFPISGEGGPSYVVVDSSKGINIPPAERPKADPVESRNWIFPFDVRRLGPRDDNGYFDTTRGRWIEFVDAKGATRRINFWQYTPRKLEKPYLYFDTSRHPAAVIVGSNVLGPYDPPAATDLAGSFALHVHAFKKAHPNFVTGGGVAPVEFINPEKFQILQCGLDDEWNEEQFERMSAHGVEEAGGDPKIPDSYLLFPDGPFIGEIADTIVNFTTETKIEDAQP